MLQKKETQVSLIAVFLLIIEAVHVFLQKHSFRALSGVSVESLYLQAGVGRCVTAC